VNTADIAIIALTAVDLAGTGAGLIIALKVLPRPAPRQPRKQAAAKPPEGSQ
jgi:hypothetical protein